MDDVTLARFAELAVDFGANVQPGQIVSLAGAPGKERLVRAIAAARLPAGREVRRRRLVRPVGQARPDRVRAPTTRSSSSRRGTASGCSRSASERGAADRALGPGRAGGARRPRPRARRPRPAARRSRSPARSSADATTNWTIIPRPTPAWAQLVHPDLEPEAALAKLEEQLLHVLRLDEADPVAAWRARADTLVAVAAALTERRFDALHYEGPGTDLTVGLLPGARWQAARFETVDGIEHMPNLPTEEVFTSPDPTRVDGHVTADASRSC